MQNKHPSIQDAFIKSEASYFKYFQSFCQYIINYFFSLSYCHSSQQEQLLAERYLLQSLMLMEKVHMHLYFRRILLGQLGFLEKEAKCYDQRNKNCHTLRYLMNIIRQHQFLKEEHKHLCKKITSQILTYYSSEGNIRIIIDAPLVPPWKPESQSLS
ncbi:hypothetical protein [Anoxybacteroides tepidamans]|uniref:hypothetical protein n=1 Tax=Anoxybacteroides tepidamans TaxID=265948 RepID=UPI0004878E51|nr:hypothetical protein [Anoxybacillus tepidamans]